MVGSLKRAEHEFHETAAWLVSCSPACPHPRTPRWSGAPALGKSPHCFAGTEFSSSIPQFSQVYDYKLFPRKSSLQAHLPLGPWKEDTRQRQRRKAPLDGERGQDIEVDYQEREMSALASTAGKFHAARCPSICPSSLLSPVAAKQGWN